MKNIIYIVLFLTIICCKQKDFSTDESVFVINIDTIKVEDVPLKLSSIFKDVRTIILSEEDEIIGNIKQLQIIDNNIFILDDRAKKLLVFDTLGNYVKQIANIGLGPGEYAELSDFCINRDQSLIYLLDDMLSKVEIYNYNSGEYINSIKLNEDASCNYLIYKDNYLYLSSIPLSLATNDNMLIKINLANNNITRFISCNKYNIGFNRGHFNDLSFFYSRTHDIPKYKQIYMNTIFAIDKEDIYPYLTIQTNNWIKETDILTHQQLMEKDKTLSMVFEEKGKAYLIRTYIEWQDFILLELFVGHDDNYILYNTKTKEVRYVSNLDNDLFYSEGNYMFPNFLFTTPQSAYEVMNVSSISSNEYVFCEKLDKKEEHLTLSLFQRLHFILLIFRRLSFLGHRFGCPRSKIELSLGYVCTQKEESKRGCQCSGH